MTNYFNIDKNKMNITSIKTFFDNINTTLEPRVVNELKKIYTAFTLATFAAGIGGYLHVISNSYVGYGALSIFGAIGTLVWLVWISPFPPRPSYRSDNEKYRLILLGLFAFFTGCNLGPLLDKVISINSLQLIIQAFIYTSFVFACFTLSVLVNPKSQLYLYLNGTLCTLVCFGLSFIITNSLLGWQLLRFNIYINLAMVCVFIIYDTHKMIDRIRLCKNNDYILESITIFLHFIDLFTYILKILLNKKKNKK